MSGIRWVCLTCSSDNAACANLCSCCDRPCSLNLVAQTELQTISRHRDADFVWAAVFFPDRDSQNTATSVFLVFFILTVFGCLAPKNGVPSVMQAEYYSLVAIALAVCAGFVWSYFRQISVVAFAREMVVIKRVNGGLTYVPHSKIRDLSTAGILTNRTIELWYEEKALSNFSEFEHLLEKLRDARLLPLKWNGDAARDSVVSRVGSDHLVLMCAILSAGLLLPLISFLFPHPFWASEQLSEIAVWVVALALVLPIRRIWIRLRASRSRKID